MEIALKFVAGFLGAFVGAWLYYSLRDRSREPLKPYQTGGYQPTESNLDPNNPPQGGSGIPLKKVTTFRFPCPRCGCGIVGEQLERRARVFPRQQRRSGRLTVCLS